MVSICLNMIVKDEADIIVDTLDNLRKYFEFSHHVICDTGSSDNTISVIREYFKTHELQGEVIECEWKD